MHHYHHDKRSLGLTATADAQSRAWIPYAAQRVVHRHRKEQRRESQVDERAKAVEQVNELPTSPRRALVLPDIFDRRHSTAGAAAGDATDDEDRPSSCPTVSADTINEFNQTSTADKGYNIEEKQQIQDRPSSEPVRAATIAPDMANPYQNSERLTRFHLQRAARHTERVSQFRAHQSMATIDRQSAIDVRCRQGEREMSDLDQMIANMFTTLNRDSELVMIDQHEIRHYQQQFTLLLQSRYNAIVTLKASLLSIEDGYVRSINNELFILIKELIAINHKLELDINKELFPIIEQMNVYHLRNQSAVSEVATQLLVRNEEYRMKSEGQFASCQKKWRELRTTLLVKTFQSKLQSDECRHPAARVQLFEQLTAVMKGFLTFSQNLLASLFAFNPKYLTAAKVNAILTEILKRKAIIEREEKEILRKGLEQEDERKVLLEREIVDIQSQLMELNSHSGLGAEALTALIDSECRTLVGQSNEGVVALFNNTDRQFEQQMSAFVASVNHTVQFFLSLSHLYQSYKANADKRVHSLQMGLSELRDQHGTLLASHETELASLLTEMKQSENFIELEAYKGNVAEIVGAAGLLESQHKSYYQSATQKLNELPVMMKELNEATISQISSLLAMESQQQRKLRQQQRLEAEKASQESENDGNDAKKRRQSTAQTPATAPAKGNKGKKNDKETETDRAREAKEREEQHKANEQRKFESICFYRVVDANTSAEAQSVSTTEAQLAAAERGELDPNVRLYYQLTLVNDFATSIITGNYDKVDRRPQEEIDREAAAKAKAEAAAKQREAELAAAAETEAKAAPPTGKDKKLGASIKSSQPLMSPLPPKRDATASIIEKVESEESVEVVTSQAGKDASPASTIPMDNDQPTLISLTLDLAKLASLIPALRCSWLVLVEIDAIDSNQFAHEYFVRESNELTRKLEISLNTLHPRLNRYDTEIYAVRHKQLKQSMEKFHRHLQRIEALHQEALRSFDETFNVVVRAVDGYEASHSQANTSLLAYEREQLREIRALTLDLKRDRTLCQSAVSKLKPKLESALAELRRDIQQANKSFVEELHSRSFHAMPATSGTSAGVAAAIYHPKEIERYEKHLAETAQTMDVETAQRGFQLTEVMSRYTALVDLTSFESTAATLPSRAEREATAAAAAAEAEKKPKKGTPKKK